MNLDIFRHNQAIWTDAAMLPKQTVILLSGIPATRKSTFARYLAGEHGFAHYDMECYPHRWPHPELYGTWNSDRPAFVAQLRQLHDRIVLDWGFPPDCLSMVGELQACGVRLIWFGGDIACARKAFKARGGRDVGCFDEQVANIQKARFPDSLDCVIVLALSSSGEYLDPRQIESLVLPGAP